MNHHRWSLSIACIALLLLYVTTVHAQTTTPLIILSNGDLWAWSEGETTMRRLSQSGYIQEIVLSPDGNRLAYTELPHVVVDAIQREGGFGGGALPTDIWVMDLAKETSQRVIAQPLGASFATQNVPDKVTVRSKPVWSPDGFQLAWTEYDVAADTQRLMASDEAGRQPRILVGDVEFSMGVTAPTQVMGWTQAGIALWNVLPAPGQLNNSQTRIEVYSGQGDLVSSAFIAETEARYLRSIILLTDNNRDYAGINYSTGEWDLVDLLTGTQRAAPSTPEAYSATSPQTSVRVLTSASGSEPPQLRLLDAQGNPIGVPSEVGYEATGTVVLSPDGQTIALRYFNTQTRVADPFITLMRGGQGVATSPTQVKGQDQFISSYVWGPIAWRLSGVPITLLATAVPFVCPGPLPTRLAIGSLAQVTFGGGPNNLRAVGSRDGVKVGEIPEGGVFSIIDGPVCADGYVWWRVYYNNETGWTAEGDNSSYFLEPVQ